MYLVYLLKSDDNKYTYIGITSNFDRRLRQHNQKISGGVKYTKKYKTWIPILIIDGFKTKREALQCEYRLKKKGRGVIGRMNYINFLLNNIKKWTKNSIELKKQNLYVHIKKDYMYLVNYEKVYELYM